MANLRAAKPWYQSKTVLLNAAAMLVVIIGYLIENAKMLSIPDPVLPWFAFIVFVLNLCLRLFSTSRPIAGTPNLDETE